MESHEATWGIAESEELLGDSLFFGGEQGSAVHYRAAQRALIPPGVVFSSPDENDRRMQAFQRIATKLYATGADGKAGEIEDCKAHPRYIPTERKAEPQPAFTGELPVVLAPAVSRARLESDLGKLLSSGDWWADYRLGASWFEAAKVLAARYPTEARAACEWSLEHFKKYGRDWTAHLPASRWDSDGSSEMQEVNTLKNALPGEASLSAPEWVCWLLAGDWQKSLAAFECDGSVEGFQVLPDILAEARKIAGQPDTGLLERTTPKNREHLG